MPGARKKFQENLSQSIEFYFDDLTMCVKKAALMRPWLSLFLALDWQSWTVVIILIYITGTTVYFFYKYYHHPENLHYCTGVAFVSLLGTSVPYNPTHGLARIHFGIMLIYALILTASINAFLTSRMTKTFYEHQISKVEELMEFEYNILTDLNMVPLYNLGNDKVNCFCNGWLKLMILIHLGIFIC